MRIIIGRPKERSRCDKMREIIEKLDADRLKEIQLEIIEAISDSMQATTEKLKDLSERQSKK